MNRASQILGWTIYVLFSTIISARGQPAPGVARAKQYIDQEVQRHRWEINVDLQELVLKNDNYPTHYPWLVKLNSRNERKARAWRFLLSPYSLNKRRPAEDTAKANFYKVKTHYFAPIVAIGHEWQKYHGRAVLFGGVDLAAYPQISKTIVYGQIKDDNDPIIRGTHVFKHYHNTAWIAAFFGLKIFFNHRFSLSTESHLQFNYGKEVTSTFFDDEQIARSENTWHEILPFSIFQFHLGYNFGHLKTEK